MGREEEPFQPAEARNLVRGGTNRFLDDAALLIDDPDHSDDEDRFVLLGLSASLRTLVVCHCYRKGGSTIRIITARKADRSERSLYSKRIPNEKTLPLFQSTP